MGDLFERRCDKCYYFYRGERAPKGSYGQCRRDPPKVRDMSFGGTQFPATYPDDWCGEFLQRSGEDVAAERAPGEISRIVKMAHEAQAAYDAMSPEEKAAHDQAQRESFVRGMTTPCEHGVLDFEQCPQCGAKAAHDRAQTELSSARAINEALKNNGYTG